MAWRLKLETRDVNVDSPALGCDPVKAGFHPGFPKYPDLATERRTGHGITVPCKLQAEAYRHALVWRATALGPASSMLPGNLMCACTSTARLQSLRQRSGMNERG